jgi:MFS transporter, putative metabolite:H+ symporter
MSSSHSNKAIILAVTVAALGYFVDIYDLILFSIVRIPSLRAIGIDESEITNKGLLLLNLQMTGMLIGGVFFGILGDKKGRISVLFASILLYSTANFLNGFVQTFEQYAILRLIAGIGLAGELGAGITLVSEILPKEKRGYGTTLIASIGVSGALLGWFVAERFDWRTAYYIGGGLGFALLALRVGVLESGLFDRVRDQADLVRGDFLSLFTRKDRLFRLLACIFMGIQLWYVVGILITLSPEFARALGVIGEVSAGKAVMFCYTGLIIGDLLSGLLSQLLRSRKKVAFIFLSLSALGIITFFNSYQFTLEQFYILCFCLGIASGYWCIFVTVAAEQFGTNLRATVATSVPNFVRGSLVPISALFTFAQGYMGLLQSGLTVGLICISLSYIGLYYLKESFHSDLDFIED